MSINQYTGFNKRLNFYCDKLTADKFIIDNLEVNNARIDTLNCPLIRLDDDTQFNMTDEGILTQKTTANRVDADSININNLVDPVNITDYIDCNKVNLSMSVALEDTIWKFGVSAKPYLLPEPNYNLSTTTFDDSRFKYYTNPLIISSNSETLSVKIACNYITKPIPVRESDQIRIRVKPVTGISFENTSVIACSGTAYATQQPQLSKLILRPDVQLDFTGSEYNLILIFEEVPPSFGQLLFLIDAEIILKKI